MAHNYSKHELHLAFHKLDDAMHKMDGFEKKPRDFGTGDFLNVSEIHTIMAIGDQPGRNITSLAEFFGVSKSAVSQMIRKLSGKNLVERYRDPSNDKEVLLRLTPRGRVAYLGHEQCHAKMDELMDKRFEEFSADEITAIGKFIDIIVNTCDALTGK